jgi:hypothetical protein
VGLLVARPASLSRLCLPAWLMLLMVMLMPTV